METNAKRKTKHYDDIDIAKGIGILLVVLGHSFLDASLGVFNNNVIYSEIEDIIYSFHMHLFIGIFVFPNIFMCKF